MTEEEQKKQKAKEASKAKLKAVSVEKGGRNQEEQEGLSTPSPNDGYLQEVIDRLTQQGWEEMVEEFFINHLSNHLPTLVIKADGWREIASFLKEDETLSYDYLQSLCGVDYPDRMEVVYQLYSFPHQRQLGVRIKTSREKAVVPSITGIWQAANWHERETFDLFGIQFTGHPNLKRILMPDQWVGHPLRKDYQAHDQEM